MKNLMREKFVQREGGKDRKDPGAMSLKVFPIICYREIHPLYRGKKGKEERVILRESLGWKGV